MESGFRRWRGSREGLRWPRCNMQWRLAKLLKSFIPRHHLKSSPDPWVEIRKSELEKMRGAIRLAKAVLTQGGNIGTRIAANGPTIGEVLDRRLSSPHETPEAKG